MINFIGIGAQRTGTSWIYGCLYEHPEICAPIKEIHFFSRPRYEKGITWYESHFKKCNKSKKIGEFSTSYLYTEGTAEKIHAHYPESKIIAVVRNPIDRAISQYWNAIKAGEIEAFLSLEEYLESEKTALAQGLYAKQLKPYFNLFGKEKLLVLVYEDAKKDPEAYLKNLYAFLEVDKNFVPSMLYETINKSRMPHSVSVEKNMHVLAEKLRKVGFDKFVHLVRRSGLPNLVRKFNTKKERSNDHDVIDRERLQLYFKEDVKELSCMLERDLSSEWKIK